MRFKCGLTEEEQKQRELQRIADLEDELRNGKVVFAWLPKTVKPGDCSWLEPVRKVVAGVGYHSSNGVHEHLHFNEMLRSIRALGEEQAKKAPLYNTYRRIAIDLLSHRKAAVRYKYEAIL